MKPLMTTQQACDLAGEMLARAGFERRDLPSRHGARYYALTGCIDLVRVSDGKRGVAENTLAKITFASDRPSEPGVTRISTDKIEQMVCQAIGRYMLKLGE